MTDKATNAAETNVEAAANAATAVPVVPAPPSKMDLCKPLFFGLKDGSVALIEGKSARATFISKAVDDLEMTKAGAATYWQNLTSLDKGGKLYPHTAKSSKKADAPTDADAAPTTEEAPAGDAETPAGDVQDENDLSHLEA